MNTSAADLIAEAYANPALMLDPQYVTGLCEGGASFTYSKTDSGIRLRFTLKLEKTNKGLTLALERFFGAGSLYSDPSAWQYCVTKRGELRKIVDHFDAFPLQGAKTEVFRLWKRIFELTQVEGPTHWVETCELAEQLSTLTHKRRRVAPGITHD